MMISAYSCMPLDKASTKTFTTPPFKEQHATCPNVSDTTLHIRQTLQRPWGSAEWSPRPDMPSRYSSHTRSKPRPPLQKTERLNRQHAVSRERDGSVHTIHARRIGIVIIISVPVSRRRRGWRRLQLFPRAPLWR